MLFRSAFPALQSGQLGLGMEPVFPALQNGQMRPGRISDEYSKGCNRLIRDNKASLLLSAEDFVQAMGWNMQTTLSEKVSVQRSLFIELSEEEQKIVAILEKLGNLQINSLVVEADIPVNKMTALLFELEMKGVIRVLAGGMYQLLN